MKADLSRPSTIQRLVWAACAASRCRQAIVGCDDPETAASLYRAANRYSEQVAICADLLAEEPLP